MTENCNKCHQPFRCYCWKESKNELPRLGEVVEGSNPKDWFYNNFGRDYFVLVEINDKLIWLTPSLTDFDHNKLKISHWRYIPADAKGKKAFVKIKKHNGFWIPKVYFEKEFD